MKSQNSACEHSRLQFSDKSARNQIESKIYGFELSRKKIVLEQVGLTMFFLWTYFRRATWNLPRFSMS